MTPAPAAAAARLRRQAATATDRPPPPRRSVCHHRQTVTFWLAASRSPRRHDFHSCAAYRLPARSSIVISVVVACMHYYCTLHTLPATHSIIDDSPSSDCLLSVRRHFGPNVSRPPVCRGESLILFELFAKNFQSYYCMGAASMGMGDTCMKNFLITGGAWSLL